MKRYLCPNGHAFWKVDDRRSRDECPICRGLALNSVTPPSKYQPTAKEKRLDFSMEHYQALRNFTEADVLQAEVYCRGAAGVSSQPPPTYHSKNESTFQEKCQAAGGQFVDVEAGGLAEINASIRYGQRKPRRPMEDATTSIIVPTAESAEKAKAIAIEAGMSIIEGDDQSLLLDLDSLDALAVFQFRFPFLRRHFEAEELARWKSKGGKGWHVQIELKKPLNAAWRIALQAGLGSDPFREMASIKCLENGMAEPSMLFRP